MKLVTSIRNKNQHERFFAALKSGLSRHACANFAGISAHVFNNWLRRAEKELREEQETEYTEWYLRLLQVEAELEMQLVSDWLSHTKTNWRAAQEFLKARFPERYSTEKPDAGRQETTIVITRDDS